MKTLVYLGAQILITLGGPRTPPALSYFFAPPGATFTIFVGFIAYGVWLLISS
jgi:hypothetical protein